jgi:hypothetical protein
VSCPSQSLCVGSCPVGVGFYGSACPGSAYDAGDIVSWNRAGPLRFTAVSDAPITGVWCPRLGLCLAADDAGRLFESDGASWRLAASAPRPFAGVACPSACVALGNGGDVFVTGGPAGGFIRAGTIGTERPLAAPARDRRALPVVRASHALRDVTHAVGGAVGYGLATPNNLPQPFASCQVSSVPCPTSGVSHCGPPIGDCLQGFYRNSSRFTQLRKGLPLSYARFFIAYDAVDYNSGGSCVASPAAAAGIGTQDFHQLVYNVQAAQADNLTPVVAFTNGTGTAVPNNPVPAIPDPSYGTAGSSPWAAWTQAGSDYYCGVLGIQLGLMHAGIGSNPVAHWEAWNEPNGATQSNSNGGGYNGSLGPTATYPAGPCGSASYNGVINDCGGEVNPGGSAYLCYTTDNDCGPTEGGELWELAQLVANTQFSGDGFTVAAVSLSDAQNSVYLGGYSSPLRSAASCSAGFYCTHALPTAVAVHDYEDPSSGLAGAAGDISRFTSSLSTDLGPGLQVWITESAVNLNDPTQSDQNRAAAVYPTGVWTGCNASFGETDHIASDGNAEFGICVDRQPSNQAAGASSFLALAGQGNGETIDQVDWYEFEAPNPSSGWDSGLLSPPTGGYKSPDLGYSKLRKSFCVLAHAVGCSASPDDAADWSTQPGGLGQ